MNSNLPVDALIERDSLNHHKAEHNSEAESSAEANQVNRNLSNGARPALTLHHRRPSRWSSSGGKRLFDCACVLLFSPILVPVFLLVGLAVRLTSSGPVLFLQKRLGRHGRIFTILKFRTMTHIPDGTHQPVTTVGNQQFTSIGRFLRRWKLDEIPQLVNVLLGDMSLVGPRPKLPQHVISDLPCRPGITGAATIAFAYEEVILHDVPAHRLEHYYHTVVLPAKSRLDTDYMARATFFSDLKLIVTSVLRRWDTSYIQGLLDAEANESGNSLHQAKAFVPGMAVKSNAQPAKIDGTAAVEQVTAY